ncbi:hypothetical protein FOQG_03854 [Fusarium oxysporum f. sp. raphani 54005]|uniref:Cytochrome b561 domain-containing protein n=4 Tax=Fusarium oxysporum TaxID=5507 RepID=X0CWJ6_FUSOX|nr:hypothetical protein FOXG_09298 [Fusarium oxysporum f. sp. lycopersici 4287]EXA38624.1 hypothetical protein FOVG_10508 [Fusarium oxysporum f. sp. pisi HDV247]EXK37316.1 hypothetical protein FOMG_08119 [Fusarium oxysporum f. sp. melonis 26406]EXK95224.1 hypothetical protein FOQG_03854 [Fusarium oxysporum f. sp. raphani 54005]KAJ4046223.1 hypothetical protein NW753_009053 [Fusarium oxysporum]KNB08392.1 hypothetical protein FOXG_09298 [Fusarium oxysporum f. sp. lycopersici 4287]
MAPATDELSAPGAVSYDSNTQVVGDGTWDFDKNTFLLPNLQGLNHETMRYNGMGNRFSTLTQYHGLVLAHAVLGTIIFLFLIPFSVMTARFYSRRPGWAIKYHGQLNVFSGLLLVPLFILGYFAVGPERSLTNPHHGIGVAIFTLFLVQLMGGWIVRRVAKSVSLRIMIHQWFGRAIALLGITQVPLGLTLYGSPLYLFILYAVWMFFLFILYFILSWRSASHRDYYMGGARSEMRSELAPTEDTRTRYTESEYFSEYKSEPPKSKAKWLGPFIALGGLAALARGRNKNKNQDNGSRVRSRSPSFDRSQRPEVLPSRTGSASYLTGHTGEKYSDVTRKDNSGAGAGGGIAKFLAVLGLGKLFSKKDRSRDEDYSEYSAVSTETPRRHRATASAPTMTDFTRTDFTSDVTPNNRREPDITRTSLLPPSGNRPPPPAMSQMRSAADGSYTETALSSPPPSVTPRGKRYPPNSGRSFFEESDYSSYVSPSRRPQPEKSGGGFAKGLLGGLGFGWFAKKMADRRAAKEEQRLRDEEDLRSGTSLSRFTGGDGHDSPTRRDSRRPIERRQTGYPPTDTLLSTEMSESTIEPRPARDRNVTLRRLTEEEAKAARGRRDSASSISGLESPSYRRRYRRDSSQKRAETAAERRAEEEDAMPPLSPPNPSFAKQKRRGKDSAYYSGQPTQAQTPASLLPGASAQFGQTVSSLAESHGTWSGITPSVNTSPPGPAGEGPVDGSAAAENRRQRRRLERRRASGPTAEPPATTNVDMFD